MLTLKHFILVCVIVLSSAGDLHDFVIEAFRPTDSSVAMCNEVGPALKLHERKPVPCRPGTVGSIVRIRMIKPGTLTVCEVEVYGGKTIF